MQITPAEIRQKNFERKMRGYHVEEVDAFLYALAHAWERVNAQYKVVTVELEQSKKEIKRLEELESALVRTIKDAEYTANNIVAQAKQEAELIIQKAYIDSEKLSYEVQKKVQAMEIRSKAEIEYTKLRLEQEVAEMQRVTCDTLQYKANLFQQLQQLAEDILLKCSQGKNVKQSMDA
jgi:cell division initiation protein